MTPLPCSYSSLSSFESCPRKYHEIKILKRVQDAPGDMALWGTRVHKAFEDYLRDGVPLDTELAAYQPYVEALKGLPGTHHIEHSLAVDKTGQPCAWGDAWWRGILDVLAVDGARATVIDHKLGKVKPSGQLLLNALLVFAHFPDVQEVRTQFAWLQFGQTTRGRILRSESAAAWAEFAQRRAPYDFAFSADIWTERPSGLCRGWCPVKDCPHWRAKK